MKLHFRPAEKAAPPLPRKPDFLTLSIISSDVWLKAFLAAENPP